MSFKAIAIYKFYNEKAGHIFSLLKKVSETDILEEITEKEKTFNILYSSRKDNFEQGQIFIVIMDNNQKSENIKRFPYIIKEVCSDLEFFEIININNNIEKKIDLTPIDGKEETHFFIKNKKEENIVGLFQFVQKNNKFYAKPENIINEIYIDAYNYNKIKNSNYYFKIENNEFFCPNELEDIKSRYIIDSELFINQILSKSKPNNKERDNLISILKDEIEVYSIINAQYSQKIDTLVKKIEFNQEYFHSVLEKYSKDYLEKNDLIKLLNLEFKSLSKEIKEKLERRIHLENKNQEFESKFLELQNISDTLYDKEIKILELDDSIKNKFEILEKYELELDKLNKIFYKHQDFKSKSFKLEKRFFYLKEINLLSSLKESLKDYKDGFFVINADASWLIPDLFWKSKGFLNGVKNPISIKDLFNFAKENPNNLIQLIILSANRAPIEGYFYQIIKAIEANLLLVYKNDIFVIPDNIIFFFQIDDDIYSAKLSDSIKKYIHEVTQENINKLISQEI